VALGFVAALAAAAAGAHAHAGPPPLSQQHALRARIDAERLYLDEAWLALLAYRKVPRTSKWRSQADEPGFFLSPVGSRDPRAEMLASAEAFFEGQAEVAADESARCRFPARYTWLQSQLDVVPAASIQQQCPALGRWYETVAADSVALNFASSYLESPSSMFGHTFLRFRRAGVPALMSMTSNYEADTSRSTNVVSYAARGLFGGFPGVVGQLPYYHRLRRYGDLDGRDVWEYPLHLDARQVELLLLALWESKEAGFDYFFVGENCGYRTLALLAFVAPDAKLLEPFPLETVPVETIRVLDDAGLVGAPQYRPSAVRTVLHHARALSAAELRAVLALARGNMEPRELDGLPIERRARILRVAAEYSSVLIHRGELDLETRSRVTRSLFEARLELAHPLPPDPVAAPASPDEGHSGRMVSVGWSSRAGTDAAEFGVAGFRHERIDRLLGYEQGAEVEVFGVRARLTEEAKLDLENAWLLRVESTTPGGWLFRKPAWSVRFGAERKSVDNDRPLVGSLSYIRGRAFDVGAGVLAVAVGASLDSSSKLRGGVAMEALVEVTLTRQDRWLSYELFAEHGRYVFGDRSHRVDYGIRIGIPLARQQGLVLSMQRSGAYSEENTIRVELRQFF
jgi:hypothetical protein